MVPYHVGMVYFLGLLSLINSVLFSICQKEEPEEEVEKIDAGKEEPLVVESLSDEPSAGWPSIGTLLTDLFKFTVEMIGM
jgi:hypothetical protein